MNLNRLIFYTTCIFIALLLSACAVGPDYSPQTNEQLKMPLKWHATLPHNGSNLQMINWWGQFNDPTLVYFIESAIKTYPDLDQSVAKIKQAQANLRAARASFLPSITGTANGSIQNNSFGSVGSTTGSSTGVPIGGSSGGVSQDFFSSATGANTAYTAGANASWEIDLFGAIASNTRVYQARLDASIANWNDVRISLAAQVADAYVNARACQSMLMIYESQYTSRLSTQKLTELKVKAGFAPDSDGKQGAGLAAQSLSNVENQKSSCEQYYNTLVALTGLSHNAIDTRMKDAYALVPLPINTDIESVPATILSQRPDVSSAERSVAAALANVDVSIANRFPQLSLTGSISANAGTLYSNVPNSWSFGPSLSLPLTDGGYLRAQESLAYAQYDEAVAVYKSKVINAVKDVENALVRIDEAHKREIAANDAVINYQEYFNAMNKKYNIGWNNLLDLETVRINLVSYQQNLTSAKLEEVQAWIALYKAVGGDWTNPQSILNTKMDSK
jgi:NodT family efflux transporter outer membrane factor (OMF) lipoprotein